MFTHATTLSVATVVPHVPFLVNGATHPLPPPTASAASEYSGLLYAHVAVEMIAWLGVLPLCESACDSLVFTCR